MQHDRRLIREAEKREGAGMYTTFRAIKGI